MSRYIATRAIRGANAVVHEAEQMLERAMEEKGAETPVSFPNTAYFMPMILGMTGAEASTIGDLKPALERARALLHPIPADRRWTPYLGETLDSGMATLIAEEVIMALRFVYGLQPEPIPGLPPGRRHRLPVQERQQRQRPPQRPDRRHPAALVGHPAWSTAACPASPPSSAAPSRTPWRSRSCASCSGATS